MNTTGMLVVALVVAAAFGCGWWMSASRNTDREDTAYDHGYDDAAAALRQLADAGQLPRETGEYITLLRAADDTSPDTVWHESCGRCGATDPPDGLVAHPRLGRVCANTGACGRRRQARTAETFCATCGPLTQPGCHSEPDCPRYGGHRASQDPPRQHAEADTGHWVITAAGEFLPPRGATAGESWVAELHRKAMAQ